MDFYDLNRGRWAIILAGGEGRRLSFYTRQLAGRATPKQFCRLIGRTSLLQQTMERVSLIVDSQHTLTALTRTHEQYYAPLLAHLPPRQLVVQPANRDTAPAIAYSLLRLSIRAPQASVALIPSDHYFSDDRLFMRDVERAFRAVSNQPDLIVLLGMTPDAPETGYGWIEAAAESIAGDRFIHPVQGFWEKPTAEFAKELMARGCFWNSFVIVAKAQALLRVIEETMPNLHRSFCTVLPALDTEYEARAIQLLYARLQSADFSRGVLAKLSANLAVLPVAGLQWSDLGDARRVMDTLSRIQMKKHYGHG
ncbi:MAG: sugar phosphate nucleotidyltransferase [Candidatus Binataceae bacterium]